MKVKGILRTILFELICCFILLGDGFIANTCEIEYLRDFMAIMQVIELLCIVVSARIVRKIFKPCLD